MRRRTGWIQLALFVAVLLSSFHCFAGAKKTSFHVVKFGAAKTAHAGGAVAGKAGKYTASAATGVAGAAVKTAIP
jgi:hypothetical protein